MIAPEGRVMPVDFRDEALSHRIVGGQGVLSPVAPTDFPQQPTAAGPSVFSARLSRGTSRPGRTSAPDFGSDSLFNSVPRDHRRLLPGIRSKQTRRPQGRRRNHAGLVHESKPISRPRP